MLVTVPVFRALGFSTNGTLAHTLLGYFAISGESVFHKIRRGHKLGRAVVNNITLPNPNIRRDKLLCEF